MTEDASLTDFADDAGTDDAESAPSESPDGELRDGADAEPPADAVARSPAVATYGWSPDGERLVCADCKEW